jgi:hypothetical protein
LGELRQAVISNHKGAELGWAQVVEAEGRHLGKTKHAASRQPTVPRNHIEISIDQDRNIKAECLDAIGELTNLGVAVLTGVSRIRLQFAGRSIDDFEALLAPFTPIRRFTHQ